ncbi:MAG: LacI family DNA-binding transcriptional regulator [Pseudomonadota bacterium]
MRKPADEAEQETQARPTTKDLARVAGVSRATVDRVLNGRDGVQAKTIERVNAAIKKLGFVRNLSAANLARSKSYRFLFVLPRHGDQFLAEILRRIDEAVSVFSTDAIWLDVHHINENDPHAIADYLSTLSPGNIDGVAIMAPETPQVRDAILRLQERGVKALPFISGQALSDADWVGIDNRSAGRTAAILLGRFVRAPAGQVLVVAESMLSRDSLERRLGFDEVLNTRFPGLTALPSLETYSSGDRARRIITTAFERNDDIVAVYVLSSEARVPLSIVKQARVNPLVCIAHERTPSTELALRDGSLDALITQNAGHLVRSAVRKLRALSDNRGTLESQEKIRIEIVLSSNL